MRSTEKILLVAGCCSIPIIFTSTHQNLKTFAWREKTCVTDPDFPMGTRQLANQPYKDATVELEGQ